MAHQSIRFRRKRKKLTRAFELQLTSLIDVLVIILVFLLKSYATSQNNLQTVPGLRMPISAAPDEPRDSNQIIVTPEGITVENERVLDFVQSAANAGATDGPYTFKKTDLDEGGKRIVPVFDALAKARDKSELLRAKSKARDAQGNPLPFDGVLAVTADKRIQYDTIRKIMYTAGAAGFKVFRLTAQRKDI